MFLNSGRMVGDPYIFQFSPVWRLLAQDSELQQGQGRSSVHNFLIQSSSMRRVKLLANIAKVSPYEELSAKNESSSSRALLIARCACETPCGLSPNP
jgi:hypothetical protein